MRAYMQHSGSVCLLCVNVNASRILEDGLRAWAGRFAGAGAPCRHAANNMVSPSTRLITNVI